MEVDTSVPEPVAKVILATGQADGETLKVSKLQNEKRAESRKKIKEAGMNTTAYGMGVKVAKMMLNQGEREDFIRDFLVTVDVLTKVQVELFPDLAMIADRKRAKIKEREARAAAKAASKTAEDIERGDPKRGGAGGADGHGKAKDAPAKPKRGSTAADRAEAAAARKAKLAETQAASPGASPGNMAAAANAEQEQKDGAALLDGAGKPKSQSQIAQELKDAAGVP